MRQGRNAGLSAILVIASILMVGCDSNDEEVSTDVFTVTVPFSLLADEVVFTDFVANLRYGVPQITANVVANGAVLAFVRDLEGTWTALPYTYGVEAVDQPFVDYTVTLGYAFGLRRLDVFVEASSADDAVWDEILDDPLLAATEVRIVILDAFLVGKTDVDPTDYEALRRRYNLPE